jgi:hypothetical protein
MTMKALKRAIGSKMLTSGGWWRLLVGWKFDFSLVDSMTGKH